MSILDEIIQAKYTAVAQAKTQQPLSALLDTLQPGTHRYLQALQAADWALIAECKLASPVKGTFPHGKTPGELAALYAANGATALSVLTDSHFNGQLAHIDGVRAVCDLPVLRKDFIVDAYQLYEARAAQADAVLLIAAILTEEELNDYLQIAAELGLDCLVEVHTAPELRKVLATPAAIIGINNRDLNTFVTDIHTSRALMQQCDSGRLIISESGVKTAADAKLLQTWGAKGILVGEGLVTAPDIAAKTRELALQ